MSDIVNLLHIREMQRIKRLDSELPKRSNQNYDNLAFIGARLDDGVDLSTLPPRIIPYGDIIYQSFTVGEYDYYRTHSGYFYKKHNSVEIKPIDKSVYFLVIRSRESFNFCPRLGSLQAGLTRGSKRFFSDRAETSKKSRLSEIQEKYKDGVK